MRTVAELVLGGEPDSVPRARRFVRFSLNGWPGDVVADTELVATELVTNATLYGQPPIKLTIRFDSVIRLEVQDAGRTAPILLQQNPDAMTGRGLGMVAALARKWGVDPADPGKTVWAELGGTPAVVRSRPQVDIDELLASWSDDEPLSDLWTVRLGSVPTDLLLSAKAHMDNVAREMTLLRDARAGEEVPAAMAELIRSATVDFADARAEIKRQAAAAGAAGHVVTELELHLPTSVAAAGQRYLAALDEADRWARHAQLLTLAPPPIHRIFRQWYVSAVVDTLRAAACGRPAPAIRPFQVVLADCVSELSEHAEASSRLELLQDLSRELADASTAQEMAGIVVERAVESLGVGSAQVRLLVDAGLRTVAFSSSAGEPDPLAQTDIPAESDAPGATVLRTGQTMYFPSVLQRLAGFAELSAAFPSDRSGCLVPLLSGGQKLGVMGLTFTGGELAGETEVAIVESVGALLAQALHRAELARAEAAQSEILSFLADATDIMITAREPSEVLERLVKLSVPRLGDSCTVYLADGAVLRRVAIAVHGFPDVGARLRSESLPLDLDEPHTRAFKTGRTVVVPGPVGPILAALHPDIDFEGIGGQLEPTTGLCVPIVLRGRTMGVVALTFLSSRRDVDSFLQDAVVGLSKRAAIALDNAERWSEQTRTLQSLVATLLPSEPPSIDGLRFVARYLPAAGDVAGDWWEAELMPDGTVFIGLGDAAGHGMDAVSQMSELRHGARALAAVEASPAALLSNLNRRLSGPDSGFATAVYGRLDPRTGRLLWASAGHVPPLVVSADGRTEVLDGGASPPLGSPRIEQSRDLELDLAWGETLVLYSDGVVERHDTGLDVGIERLRETISGLAGSGLDELADTIIKTLCAERLDDCCLLLVRREEPGPE